jgi:2-polyprenyl-6-methoxyphenol hydroxylase-like FAD-dependent oxidoreductase
LVDKLPEPSGNSRAIVVHPRTLELFDQIGIVQAVLEQSVRMRGLSFWAGERALARVPVEALDSPYPFMAGIAQAQTERILREYLAGLGVTPEWGVELTAFAQDETGVMATLRHPAGTSETVRASWLLGCDGAHSAVRKGLGWEFAGQAIEHGFAVGDLHVDWALARDDGQVFLHPSGLLSAYPFGEDRWRVTVQVPPPGGDGPQPAPTLADFQGWMDERGPHGATVSAPGWLARFRVSFRHAPQYRAGRIFVAGDAAHIHSPAGGQGMNTCIQDAVNLGWKLALVHRGLAPATLLDSYQAEREPVAQDVLRRVLRLTRLATTQGALAHGLRTRVVPLLLKQEAVQRRGIQWASELEVHYRQSPIVGGSRGGSRRWPVTAPRPGDRAPDVGPLRLPDGTTARLFALLRDTRHTLLLFAGPKPGDDTYAHLQAIAAALQGRFGDVVREVLVVPSATTTCAPRELPLVGDLDQALHQRYGVAGDALYLIRPDGYVAYRAQPADLTGLIGYLERIFVVPAAARLG